MPAIETCYRGGDAQQRPGFWFRFDYDEDTIAALKAAVPASDRTWDAERRLWWVSERYGEAALRVLPGLEAYLRQAALF